MQNRTVVRYMLDGVGAILAAMFLSGGGGGGWLLVLGVIALFMGMTDFGRQCPLVLSVRHLAYRIRSKGKPPILSAKSIEELNKADRNKTLS